MPRRYQKSLPTRCSLRSAAAKGQANNCCEATNPPDSPSTKKFKRLCNRKIQKQAFAELLVLVAANGGGTKQQYGSIQKVLTKYQKNGYTYVTRRNLEYRMQLHRSGCELKDERTIPTKISTNVTGVSSLTGSSAEKDRMNEGRIILKNQKKKKSKNLLMEQIKDAI